MTAISRRGLLIDGVATLLVAGLVVWESVATASGDDGYAPAHVVLPLSIVISVLAVLPLAIRRVFPVIALALTCALVLVPAIALPVRMLFFGGFGPATFLLYTVARYRSLRVAVAAGVAMAVPALVNFVLTEQSDAVSDLAFTVSFQSLAILVGVALRRSAEQKRRLAELLAQVEAEQADHNRLVVLDERASLARDLHDVVAHAVSLMLVQAGAARMAVGDDPAMARQFLLGVEEAGRHATGDLRHMLGVLRADDSAGVEPVAGLANVGDLVARMRAAGLRIVLDVTGEPPHLDAGLDVAVFRILQEALTNVVKHAGPTRVRLSIDYADPIHIAVHDDGPEAANPPRPVPSGHGLVGMAQRVALFGGRLDAGRDGRGFRVDVTLPLPVMA